MENNSLKASTSYIEATQNMMQISQLPPAIKNTDVAAPENTEEQLFSMFLAHEYSAVGTELKAKGIKNSKASGGRSFSQIVEYIRTNEQLKSHTLKYRDLKKKSVVSPSDKQKENAAKYYKLQHFDYVVFSGILGTGHRANYDVVELTGYIGLDIDSKHNPGKSLEEMKEAVFSVFGSSVSMLHTTMSGLGIHAIIHHGIHDKTLHTHIYTYCETLLKEKDFVTDPACKDPSRGFFLNHDPEIYYNAGAKAFAIPAPLALEFKESASGSKPQYTQPTQSSTSEYAGSKSSDAFPGTPKEWEEAQFMIDKYCELNLQKFGDRNSWKRALFALYNSFGEKALSQFEQLSLHSPNYNRDRNAVEIKNFLKEYPTYTGNRLHWMTLRKELHDMGVPYLQESAENAANFDEYDDLYWHAPTLDFGADNPEIIELIRRSYNTPRFQYTAMGAALTIISSLLKNARYRNPFSNSIDRLTLNFLVVGEPGTGKNTTLQPLVGLFEWYDGEIKQAYNAAHREWELGLAECTSKREKDKYIIDNPEPEEKCFVLGGDFTDASLAVDMHANKGEGLMYTTEGEEILKALRGKFGSESATILRKAFSGEQHRKRRGGKDDFGKRYYEYTASFSILAGVQIGVYLALLGDTNGLAERFQLCSTLLPRERKTEEEKKIPALTENASLNLFDAANEIKNIVRTIKQRQYPLLITFDNEQSDMVHQWLDRQEKEFGVKVSGYNTHGSEFIYRLAALRCILNGAYKSDNPEFVASDDDITWGMNFFDQSRAMFKPFLERIKNTADKQEETFIEAKSSLGLFLTLCPEHDFFPQEVKTACQLMHISPEKMLKKALNSGYIAKRGTTRAFPYYLTTTGMKIRDRFLNEQQKQQQT